jgi:hypothetical protein
MIKKSFIVYFEFPYPSKNGHLDMSADIEQHHSQTYYVVDNFRIVPRNSDGPVLPSISIRKLGDAWLHTETNKETQLSRIVGEAIDKAIDG